MNNFIIEFADGKFYYPFSSGLKCCNFAFNAYGFKRQEEAEAIVKTLKDEGFTVKDICNYHPPESRIAG